MTKRIAPDSSANVSIASSISQVGKLDVFPEEILPQIIARVFSPENIFSAARCVPLVCRVFEAISNRPSTFDLCLDQALRGKTTFHFNAIHSYRILLERRCKRAVPLFEIFARYPQFTHVEGSGRELHDGVLAELIRQAIEARCTLQSLQLHSCPMLIGQFDVKGLSRLEVLRLEHCVNLLGLLHLSELKLLKVLNLTNCYRLTGTLDLQGLGQLQDLVLNGCTGLTGELDFEELGQLETLSLFDCDQLTELLHLEALVRLKKLDLRGCRGLARVDLRGLPATAEVIR